MAPQFRASMFLSAISWLARRRITFRRPESDGTVSRYRKPRRVKPSRTRAPRPTDALYRNVQLPHSVAIPVLGVPVEFLSNSAAAVEAARESFEIWQENVSPSPGPAREPIRVRVVLHHGDEGGAGPAPLVYRMPDPRQLLIHSAGSVGLADLRHRE